MRNLSKLFVSCKIQRISLVKDVKNCVLSWELLFSGIKTMWKGKAKSTWLSGWQEMEFISIFKCRHKINCPLFHWRGTVLFFHFQKDAIIFSIIWINKSPVMERKIFTQKIDDALIIICSFFINIFFCKKLILLTYCP